METKTKMVNKERTAHPTNIPSSLKRSRGRSKRSGSGSMRVCGSERKQKQSKAVQWPAGTFKDMHYSAFHRLVWKGQRLVNVSHSFVYHACDWRCATGVTARELELEMVEACLQLDTISYRSRACSKAGAD